MIRPQRVPRLSWPPAWSYTLHRLLHGQHRCERSLYWRYAAARIGAHTPKGSAEHRAWVLSQLTALPLLLGITVHNAARAVFLAIRNGEPLPDYAELLTAARHTLNHVWFTSTRHVDRFYRWPGAYTALREVIYHGGLREVEIARARWGLAACLEHLLNAPLLTDLQRCRPDDILIGDVPAQFQPVPGISAWAALDLAYVHYDPATCGGLVSGPTWCIVDVKTGAPATSDDAADHARQLAVYATFASQVLRLPTNDGVYLGRIAHLRQGTDTWHRITADDVERVRSIVLADTAWLRDRAPSLADEPLPAKNAFSLCDDRRCCARCSYFALCRDELRERDEGRRTQHGLAGDNP